MGRAVLALAGKDMRILLRDRGGVFVTFVFPFIYCVFFGLVFAAGTGNDRAIDLVVVDEDNTPGSANFVAKLESAPEFCVSRAKRHEAVDLVRRGKRVAYVVLTKGFGEASERILMNHRPRLEVGLDPARQAEAAMVKGMLTKYAFETVTDLFGDRHAFKRRIETARSLIRVETEIGIMDRAPLARFLIELDRFVDQHDKDASGGATDGSKARDTLLHEWEPIELSTVDVGRARASPNNSYEISFPQGIIWGVLGCCASFGVSLVIERTSGTLSRLRVAPIARGQILAGKALACFGSTVTLAAVLFLVGRLFFGVVACSPLHLAVSLVLIAVAFVGIMMFLSILGRTERTVSGISWAVLLAMAMSGGGMVPRMFMPPWMQSLSHVSPVRWAILAMEGAVWRDFSTREMLVPWAVLLTVGVVLFAAGVRGFAWMDEG